MSKYFYEGAVPHENDSNERSLQKINSLLYNTVDSSGKIQVGGVTLQPLDINTTNALLTVQGADTAAIKASSSSISGMAVPSHNYMSLSYTGSNLTGVVYKTGGSSGTIVATLTLAYDGSGNLTSVSKS
jgi:hypothetical protein